MRFAYELLLLLLLAGCGLETGGAPCAIDARCLRYGLSADIAILDPHYADLPEAGMIFRQLYDTLVVRGADSHGFTAGLATGWDISPDGQSYTFQLRQDVTFHDGTRFDAAAVAQNIQRIYSPEMPPGKARALLGPLSQYEIIDEFTIRLILSAPYAGFLDGLAQPFLGIASPKALEAYSDLRYQFHQSGTGPFVLEEYLPGERILLRRSGNYRLSPASADAPGADAIERVEFVILPAESRDTLSLLNDSFDVIDDIAPVDAQNLSANSRVRILPTAIPGLSIQFLFNTNRAHVGNPIVRRALLLATNRVAISDRIFYNFAPVAWAPLSESTGYSHTGFVNHFSYDLSQAQSLLAEAGYADSDGDGILERSGAPLELRIVVPPWRELPRVAAFLREQWRVIGVDLSIEPVPGNSRLEALIRSGEYDLLPVEIFGIDPSLLGEIVYDDALYRASRAPQAQLTDMLVRADQEADPQARRNLFYEIQSLMMNEVLVLPVQEAVRLTATRAGVRNLVFDAYGFNPLLFNTAASGQ